MPDSCAHHLFYWIIICGSSLGESSPTLWLNMHIFPCWCAHLKNGTAAFSLRVLDSGYMKTRKAAFNVLVLGFWINWRLIYSPTFLCGVILVLALPVTPSCSSFFFFFAISNNCWWKTLTLVPNMLMHVIHFGNLNASPAASSFQITASLLLGWLGVEVRVIPWEVGR